MIPINTFRMPEEHCFVCASNKGIFLDIFTDEKNYQDIIETCLSLKIEKKKMQSTKICHKCVYELDQCSKFVQKYKKTHRIEKGKLCKKRGCCCLCMELGKKGYLFNLWDKNRVDNSVEKLNELFDIDPILDNLSSLSICLDCRYNLDILIDMKSLFKVTSRFLENVLNGVMELSEFPKISTSVVKRQTTLTQSSKLSQLKSSSVENETSTVELKLPKFERALNSRKSSPHERKCDECNTTIDNGMDMYRYHHTGNTVCKDCWLTMDPCEKTKSIANKVKDTAMKTKLCSVFLKDILSNELETEKRTSSSKVDKGSDIEVVYVISSDEIDNENEKKKLTTRSTRMKRKQPTVEAKPKKRLKTQYPRRAKLARSNSAQSINQVNRMNTRLTRSESAETSDSEGKNLRTRSQIIGKSEASTSKLKRGKKAKESPTRGIHTKRRKKNKIDSSSSGAEIILPSKVRRFTSPTYKINSSDSKNESDSDSIPYVCKICSNSYKNKAIGKKHELSHTKKLEVTLQKIELPEQSEENKRYEIESSTEFNSPSPSDEDPTKISNNIHLAITDTSTSDQPFEINEDPSNDNSLNRGSKVKNTAENNKDENQEKKQKKNINKAKSIKKGILKNKKQRAEINKKKTEEKIVKENAKIEEKDKSVAVEEANEENGVERREENEDNTEKEQSNERETEKEHSTTGSIHDGESVHETINNDIIDIDEQPLQTDEPNLSEEIPQLNKKEASKNIKIVQNKISGEEKNDEVIENEIEKVEKNKMNISEKNENVKDLLENDENRSERDSASSNAIIERSTEKSTDKSNETNEENKPMENENLTSKNKEADKVKEVDKNQEDEGVKNDVENGDKNEEKTFDETISNGNVRNLLDVDSTVSDHDDDEVRKSAETESTADSAKSEECSHPKVEDDKEKSDDIVIDETNNVAQSDKVKSSEKDLNEDTKNESTTIEEKLAEMMGENEEKCSKICDKKTSDAIKNIKQTLTSDSPVNEKIICES